MPRKKLNEIRKKFEKLGETNMFKCTFCDVKLTGDNATNMSRHLEKKHENEATKLKLKILHDTQNLNLQKQSQKICLSVSEKNLWDGCIEMAASGYPLSFITNNGFKKIIAPMTKKLNISNQFNVPNLKLKIKECADAIKSEIIDDVKNKFVSLKVDGVTRHSKSLLGVNIQYIKNGKIVVKTLAMKELTEKHAADYIKRMIIDVISDYGKSDKFY